MKRGFTLVELLVVVGMIALIMGAMTTSVSAGMQRSKIQKATGEVKMLTQAIQSYADYNEGELTTIPDWSDANFRSGGVLAFLNEKKNGEIPVLIQAALLSGYMNDPWGHPYQVKITEGQVYVPSLNELKSGYYQANFYRLTEDERK